MDKKRVLIIDGNNNFIRAYIMDPSISSSGQPIGGIKGFLKILQKLCKETKPNRVVICWDGQGGSAKRKIMNKNYKDGRKPIRLNRNIQQLEGYEEINNKIWQMTRTVEYLNEMPIVQLLLDGVEADDCISAIVQHRSLKSYNKIIVSSDKDFIQLCDDSTVLYRPVQQEVLNKKKVVEEYGIHPNNFCLARAITGDKSDNLDGIEGIGLPTVAKRIPMLAEEKVYNIEDVLEYCRGVESNVKAYNSILEGADKIKDNYKIMQLGTPDLSVQDSMRIDAALEESECTMNKTEIVKMMLTDGFGEGNWEDLFLSMRLIQLENC